MDILTPLLFLSNVASPWVLVDPGRTLQVNVAMEDEEGLLSNFLPFSLSTIRVNSVILIKKT